MAWWAGAQVASCRDRLPVAILLTSTAPYSAVQWGGRAGGAGRATAETATDLPESHEPSVLLGRGERRVAAAETAAPRPPAPPAPSLAAAAGARPGSRARRGWSPGAGAGGSSESEQ